MPGRQSAVRRGLPERQGFSLAGLVAIVQFVVLVIILTAGEVGVGLVVGGDVWPYPSDLDLVALFEGHPACAVQNSAVSVHVLLQREVEFFFKAQHLGFPSVLFNFADRTGYGA